MAFRGETAQISLVNIFQTLSLSGQKGVFEIQWRDQTRRFRFLGGAVRVIPDHVGAVDPLRGMLVKLRVLTDAQWSNVQESLPPNTLLGDALLERRILTPDHVQGALRSQCEELLLAAFTWADAAFHFSAGQGADTDEFFASDTFGSTLAFDVTALVMEAARREDEWARIREIVPDPHEIVVPTDRRTFEKTLGEEGFHDGIAAALADLLNGFNDLGSVVRSSPFSAFQIFQPVATLLQKGVVRALTSAEKKELAERYRRQFRFEETARILRSVVKAAPDDREARRGLTNVLVRLRETKELLTHWGHLAKQASDAGDLPEAKNYFLKILSQAPEDLAIHAALMELYRSTGKDRDAVDAARRLVQAARTHEDIALARTLVARCAEMFPEELAFKHALAAACFRADDREAALAALGELADHYKKTGQITNLRRTYEQIVKIDPQASRRLAYIADCERRQKRDFSQLVRWGITRGAILVGIIAVAFVALQEFRAYRALAHAQDRIREYLATERFADAEGLLDRTGESFPYSTTHFWLRKIHAEIQEASKIATMRQAQLRQERRLAFETRVTRAKIIIPKGEILEAWEILTSVPAEELEPAMRDEAVALASKLRTYLDAAASLATQAQKAEEAGRWREAFLFWQELTEKYPNAPQSKTMRFPLQVETAPPRCEILLDDKLVALAPQIIRWSPAKPAELTIKKESYLPYRKLLADLNDVGWSLTVSLQRLASWQYACDGAVEGRPASLGDRIFLADRSGTVYGIGSDKGVPAWRRSLGDIGGAGTDLTVWQDSVVLVTVEGVLYRLSRDGDVLAKRDLTSLGPIRLNPTPPTDDGIVVVAAESGELIAVSLANSTTIWTGRMPDRIRGHPARRDRTLVVGDGGGNLWRFDVGTGKVTGQRRLEGAIVVPPLPVSDTETIVVAGSEIILASESGDGRAPLGGLPTAAFVTAGDQVYGATSDDSLVAFRRADLRFLWRIKLPETCTSLAAKADRIYAACGRQVIALDTNGTTLWRFQGAGKMWSLTLLDAERLLATGEERLVYLFNLEHDR